MGHTSLPRANTLVLCHMVHSIRSVTVSLAPVILMPWRSYRELRWFHHHLIKVTWLGCPSLDPLKLTPWALLHKTLHLLHHELWSYATRSYFMTLQLRFERPIFPYQWILIHHEPLCHQAHFDIHRLEHILSLSRWIRDLTSPFAYPLMHLVTTPSSSFLLTLLGLLWLWNYYSGLCITHHTPRLLKHL